MAEDYPPDDVLTRSQVEERRGGFEGDGRYDLVAHHSNGATAVAEEVVLRTCDGCGSPLTPAQQRWCSRRCMKRAQYERSKGRTPAVTVRDQTTVEDAGWSLPTLVGLLLDRGAALSIELNGVVINASLPT